MANESIFIKEGMRKLFYFNFNHKHDFLTQVWGDDERMLDHLQAKLSGMMGDSIVTSPDVIMRFISELDSGNQDKLFEYIIDNH